MSGKKSKDKGKRLERELCALLGDIFGEKFVRNVTSGAYVGGKNISRRNVLSEYQTQMVVGDIIPPEKYSKMIIECKGHRDFTISSLFFGKYAKLGEWIEQYELYYDSEKINVLFCKENGRGWCMIINEKYIKKMPRDISYLRISRGDSWYFVFPMAEVSRNVEYFKKLFST